MQSSLGLFDMDVRGDAELAKDYCQDSIACLKEVTNLQELDELLSEFSAEALVNLPLKQAAFKIKEFVVICLEMIQSLLYSAFRPGRSRKSDEILPLFPAKQGEEMLHEKLLNGVKGETMIARLHRAGLYRMMAIESLMKAICSIFFCSEGVLMRENIFLGPRFTQY